MLISEKKRIQDHAELVKPEPDGKTSPLEVPLEPEKLVLNLPFPSKLPCKSQISQPLIFHETVQTKLIEQISPTFKDDINYVQFAEVLKPKTSSFVDIGSAKTAAETLYQEGSVTKERI